MTSILVGFVLAFLIFPLPLFPQLNVVVKHKSAALSFVQATAVAQSGSSLASITSPAITTTAADFIYVLCRSGPGSTPNTVSSSPSSIWTASTQSGQDSSGAIRGFWTFSAAGGSTTFTCTPNVTVAFQAMIVLDYHKGFLTVLDADVGQIGGSTSSTATTTSFSTTAKGLIVMCTLGSNVTNNFSGGAIGSGTGTMRETDLGNTSTGSIGCEDSMPLTSQNTITASMGIGTSNQWVTVASAFK